MVISAIEPLLYHARDGPIERPGAQAKLAVGARLHVLDDGVAVALLVDEGQEDVERCRWQRQKGVDFSAVNC